MLNVWVCTILIVATSWAAAQPPDQSTEHSSAEVKSSSKLPWSTTLAPPRLPGRKFKNAKEYLELLGVDASQWNNFFHDKPLGPADEEWINRILFHLPRVGEEQLFRWRKEQWSADDVAADPANFQGESLQLRGRATKLERIELLPEVVDRYEYSHYFRIHIQLQNEHTAVVCTRQVPAAWLKAESLNERVTADAMFMKLSPEEHEPSKLVCAALRIAWLPDKVDTARGLTENSVFLAEQGFDHGLWDALPTKPTRGLHAADREPFYHLLGAIAKAPVDDPAFSTAPELDIAAAIRTPESQRGRLISVRGTVQRIDKVEISDTEFQVRFGLDHYYTLFVFVPLGNLKVRLESHEKARLFENQFPVTVCVAELPEGLHAGPNVRETIAMKGVYYRIWNYKISGGDQDLLQPSPLVIGHSVRVVQREQGTGDNAMLGIAFIGILGLVAVCAWWLGRGDARFQREVIKKRVLKEDDVNLRELE